MAASELAPSWPLCGQPNTISTASPESMSASFTKMGCKKLGGMTQRLRSPTRLTYTHSPTHAALLLEVIWGGGGHQATPDGHTMRCRSVRHDAQEQK